MKKGTIISLFALMVAVVGLLIALVAYFRQRSCALCDDLEDDMMGFYDDDECCEGNCEHCAPAEAAAEPKEPTL